MTKFILAGVAVVVIAGIAAYRWFANNYGYGE